jgi:hypothetical protein
MRTRMDEMTSKAFVGKVLIITGIVCFILTIAHQGHFGFSVYKGEEYIGVWQEEYAPIPHYPPNDNADYLYMNLYKFENIPDYDELRIFHYCWVAGGHIVDDEPVRVWYKAVNNVVKVVKVGYNIHYNQVEYTKGYSVELIDNIERVHIWFASQSHTPSLTPIAYGWEAFWRVAPLVVGILLGMFFIITGYLYISSSQKGGRMI